MKKYLLIICCTLALASAKGQVAQTMKMPAFGLPWKSNELLEPADLNTAMKAGKSPVILNIGVVEDLPGAKHIGPVSNPENLKKLRTVIAQLSKKQAVVIYCGCCPFGKCPNIQPAYILLKENGFTDIRVLDLPENLKTNWIDAGYPTVKS